MSSSPAKSGVSEDLTPSGLGNVKVTRNSTQATNEKMEAADGRKRAKAGQQACIGAASLTFFVLFTIIFVVFYNPQLPIEDPSSEDVTSIGSQQSLSSQPLSESEITAIENGKDANLDKFTYPGVTFSEVQPEKVGMSKRKLDEALNYAFDANPQFFTQGVVVIRHGVIVAEKYAPTRNKESLATSWSMGKSFGSAMIGMAIDKGYIADLDDEANLYIEGWKNDTEMAGISVRHILEMRSGLRQTFGGTSASVVGLIVPSRGFEFEALGLPYTPVTTGALPWGNVNHTAARKVATMVPDPLVKNRLKKSVEKRKADFVPGFVYQYSNDDSFLLEAVFKGATNMSLKAAAEEWLWPKIGVTDADWWQDADGNTFSYCCVDASTRSYGRVGTLFARNGKWPQPSLFDAESKKYNTSELDQVISTGYVSESTKGSTEHMFTTSYCPKCYGLHWYTNEEGSGQSFPEEPDWDYFVAHGLHENDVYVWPQHDLVVVRNSFYERIGEGPKIRYNDSAMLTFSPRGWNRKKFLRPILESLAVK